MNHKSEVWLYKRLRNLFKTYFRETGDTLSIMEVNSLTEDVFDDLTHNGEISKAEEDSTEPAPPVQ
jgi:hypothetical protein